MIAAIGAFAFAALAINRGEPVNAVWLVTAALAVYQVFGVPDYRAYLRHMRARHPGAPCLSEREFFARWVDHRYGRKGPRCC